MGPVYVIHASFPRVLHLICEHTADAILLPEGPSCDQAWLVSVYQVQMIFCLTLSVTVQLTSLYQHTYILITGFPQHFPSQMHVFPTTVISVWIEDVSQAIP